MCGGESKDKAKSSGTDGNGGGAAFLLLGVLIQPALVIIDHGHFQYNAVCLGLALGSFHFMTKMEGGLGLPPSIISIGWNCVVGSILFCLALIELPPPSLRPLLSPLDIKQGRSGSQGQMFL